MSHQSFLGKHRPLSGLPGAWFREFTTDKVRAYNSRSLGCGSSRWAVVRICRPLAMDIIAGTINEEEFEKLGYGAGQF